MSPTLWVAVALAGALGSLGRLVVDRALSQAKTGRLGLGTLAVNLSGSVLVGLLAGLAAHHLISPALAVVGATGFCGGYTTFSTFALESSVLLAEGGVGALAANVAASTVAGVAAAALGLWLGGL